MIRQGPNDFPFDFPVPPKMQPLDIQTQYDGDNINTRAQTPGVPVHTQPFNDLLKFMFKNQRPLRGGPSRPAPELGSKGGPDPVRRTGSFSMGNPAGDPIFVKELNGFNMSGLDKAQPWERGAAFTGHYGKQNPDSSHIADPGSRMTAPGISPMAATAGRVDAGQGAMAAQKNFDPNPNGTGAAFEYQRMLQAKALSDANYSKEQDRRGY